MSSGITEQSVRKAWASHLAWMKKAEKQADIWDSARKKLDALKPKLHKALNADLAAQKKRREGKITASAAAKIEAAYRRLVNEKNQLERTIAKEHAKLRRIQNMAQVALNEYRDQKRMLKDEQRNK